MEYKVQITDEASFSPSPNPHPCEARKILRTSNQKQMRIEQHIQPSRGAAIEKAEELILSRAGVKTLHDVTVKDVSGYHCGCGETPTISMNAWAGSKFYYQVVAICPNCSPE